MSDQMDGVEGQLLATLRTLETVQRDMLATQRIMNKRMEDMQDQMNRMEHEIRTVARTRQIFELTPVGQLQQLDAGETAAAAAAAPSPLRSEARPAHHRPSEPGTTPSMIGRGRPRKVPAASDAGPGSSPAVSAPPPPKRTRVRTRQRTPPPPPPPPPAGPNGSGEQGAGGGGGGEGGTTPAAAAAANPQCPDPPLTIPRSVRTASGLLRLWRQDLHGWGPIEVLERRWGSRWRDCSNNEMAFFSKRRKIVTEVERRARESGLSEEMEAELMDQEPGHESVDKILRTIIDREREQRESQRFV